jgi:hypothetical protein
MVNCLTIPIRRRSERSSKNRVATMKNDLQARFWSTRVVDALKMEETH